MTAFGGMWWHEAACGGMLCHVTACGGVWLYVAAFVGMMRWVVNIFTYGEVIYVRVILQLTVPLEVYIFDDRIVFLTLKSP